jgi:hypothetical protein
LIRTNPTRQFLEEPGILSKNFEAGGSFLSVSLFVPGRFGVKQKPKRLYLWPVQGKFVEVNNESGKLPMAEGWRYADRI